MLILDILPGIADLENTAPRIKSDFKPKHDEIIRKQKQAQIRKQRPLKRIATVVIGLGLMAYMIYLIIVTQRAAPKIYDPYEILGLSRVRLHTYNPVVCEVVVNFSG